MRRRDGSGNDIRTEKVSLEWGRWAAVRDDREFMKRVAWAEYPVIQRYVNSRISGDQEVEWLEWLAKEHLKGTAKLGLSLGSGSGYLERRVLELGIARKMEGVDVSEEALEVALESAGGRPIEYRRLDLNHEYLDEDRYDFVISAALLHHITNLEHCLAQVHRSLREGGLLIVHEFVGPDRFQWTDAQLELVNRAYRLLPEGYRYNHLTGRVHPEIERRPLHYMIEADPSEAVRSSEILEVLSWFFETVQVREVGGTLLHPLLEGIVGNFDETSEKDRSLLKMLIALEEEQIGQGHLPSDFVVVVARKKQGRISPEAAMRMGKEKVDIITRQEEEILGLNRRLEEAERQNRALKKIADEHLEELEEFRREREKLLDENRALKSSGPFRALRFLRAKIRGFISK